MTAFLSVSAGQHSQAGVKPINEDSCGIRIPDPPLLDTKGIAAVIADGVSSCAAGREASESCVQGFLSDYYSTPESWCVKTSVRRVLGAVNRWLYGQGQQVQFAAFGMISTLSVLVIKSTTAHLFHVGDTRIYRRREGDLECLTADHQVVSSGGKTFLSRAMGVGVHIEIDYRTVPVEAGDLYLLTTDGVHRYLGDGELLVLLSEHRWHPEQAARAIVARALEQGSQDNVTCQVLRVDGIPFQDDKDAFYRHLTELPFPPPLETGMVLDGYRILRELHASKRTQVYLALDPETEQRVVVKTPSVNYADDAEYIDRFLHEEWAGRRINNPHVLSIREQRRRRRFLYYVTEYAEGRDLRQWMHDNPRPPLVQVRDIVEQIARGLRAFHRLEMIHQDLKPENLRVDAHDTVKIIDFGSTRIAGIDEIATPLGLNADVLGTRNYTAPEYLSGGIGSNRSDIFSLGVIAYEMLTGRLPYGDDLGGSRKKRPAYISARQHNPDVPAWMDGALRKAVQINPAARYRHLSEFIYDLSHRNPKLVAQPFEPLLTRNPAAFWRGLAALLLLLNVLQFYLLVG